MCSEPPKRRQGISVPVQEVDTSGAEPGIPGHSTRGRRAAGRAGPDAAPLAAAYGRLGALFTEVETQATPSFAAPRSEPQEFRWPVSCGLPGDDGRASIRR